MNRDSNSHSRVKRSDIPGVTMVHSLVSSLPGLVRDKVYIISGDRIF